MMKKLLTATAIGLALLTWHTSCTQQPKAPEAFTPIKVETPARPAGQEDVIQLVTPKIDTVRVGFIGLVMLPIYLGFFAGVSLFIYFSFTKDFEIQNIVFTQAYSEKYKFKNSKLQDSFEAWQRKKINSGEIK
jgi:hypothetical protein